MVTPSRAITMPDVGYPPKHKNDGYYEISPCLWFKIQPVIYHPDSLGLTSTANFLYAHPSQYVPNDHDSHKKNNLITTGACINICIIYGLKKNQNHLLTSFLYTHHIFIALICSIDWFMAIGPSARLGPRLPALVRTGRGGGNSTSSG